MPLFWHRKGLPEGKFKRYMRWIVRPLAAIGTVSVIAAMIIAIIHATEKSKYCANNVSTCALEYNDVCTISKVDLNLTCEIDCDTLPDDKPVKQDCFYNETSGCYSIDCEYNDGLYTAIMTLMWMGLGYCALPFFLIIIFLCLYKNKDEVTPQMLFNNIFIRDDHNDDYSSNDYSSDDSSNDNYSDNSSDSGDITQSSYESV